MKLGVVVRHAVEPVNLQYVHGQQPWQFSNLNNTRTRMMILPACLCSEKCTAAKINSLVVIKQKLNTKYVGMQRPVQRAVVMHAVEPVNLQCMVSNDNNL